MLEGRIAYVTGSTRGIGLAVARVFAEHGASIVVNGRALATTLAVAEQIGAEFGVRTLAVVADQGSYEEIQSAYEEIFGTFKRLDVLVNNAGIMLDGVLGMVPAEHVADTFAVNAAGVFHNMQNGARLMRRAGGGSIINISSVMGIEGNAGQVAYSGSKAAVIGMTYAASKELAPAGIRVNAIAPGFIETDLTASLPDDVKESRIASIAMGCAGSGHDVANTALFLASDMSAYVTGQVIAVDGGMRV